VFTLNAIEIQLTLQSIVHTLASEVKGGDGNVVAKLLVCHCLGS
jgi:hypothetical protein